MNRTAGGTTQRGGTSPSNRSLERGMEILRAFRPGLELLGNGEIAERSGLSAATVSRLTQTLVRCGFLEHDRKARAYRLAAPVLSLAHAMLSGSSVLQAAAPLMRAESEKRRINVGLAVADRDEMVYLESIRYNRKVSLRNIVAGQRIPMELTSLGRAYLATLPKAERDDLFKVFRMRRQGDWKTVEKQISQAARNVQTYGYCAASWQPEVVAVAAPIIVPGRPVLILNFSTTTQAPMSEVSAALGEPLLAIARRIRELLVI